MNELCVSLNRWRWQTNFWKFSEKYYRITSMRRFHGFSDWNFVHAPKMALAAETVDPDWSIR